VPNFSKDSVPQFAENDIREGVKADATVAQVVERGYQVAQAAA
jgi:hypothetical protein